MKKKTGLKLRLKKESIAILNNLNSIVGNGSCTQQTCYKLTCEEQTCTVRQSCCVAATCEYGSTCPAPIGDCVY